MDLNMYESPPMAIELKESSQSVRSINDKVTNIDQSISNTIGTYFDSLNVGKIQNSYLNKFINRVTPTEENTISSKRENLNQTNETIIKSPNPTPIDNNKSIKDQIINRNLPTEENLHKLQSLKPNDHNSFENKKKNFSNEPIYVMTIELDKKASQKLSIYPNSNPEELAFEFCKRNNLDSTALSYLSEEIKKLMKSQNENFHSIQEVDEENVQSSEIKNSDKNVSRYNRESSYYSSITNQPNINSNISGLIEDKKSDDLISYTNYEDLREDKDSNLPDHKISLNEVKTLPKTYKLDEMLPDKSSEVNYRIFHNFERVSNPNKFNQELEFINNNKFKTKNKITQSHLPNEDIPKRKNLHEDLYRNAQVRQNLREKIYNERINQEYKPIGSSSEKLKAYNLTNDDMHLNNGEKLYLRSRFKQDETKYKILKAREVQEKKEMDSNNAKLNIHYDRNITSLFKRGFGFSCTLDYIQSIVKDREKKIQLMKSSKPVEHYSFSPRINERSKIIDNANSYLTMKDFNYGKNFTEGNSQNEYNKGNPNTSRSLSPNIQRQHLLYEKSKSKSKRIKQLGDMIYSRYTFKPNLSESKGFYPSNKNPILNQTFNNRLDIYQKQNEERQRELYSYYSPYNSNNAFHPKILANYKTEKRDVFYNNFIYAQKYENNRQIKQNELNNRYSEMSKTQLINKESVVIFNSMKEKIFKQIFLILDSDGDGIINTLNKDIKSLPDDVESVISPILLELKEENETLNEKEFTLACYHLYELLNYNERRILLNFGTQNRTLMQSKTNSNTNSKKTLRQLRPNQSYDINLIKEEINRSAQNSKSSFRK